MGAGRFTVFCFRFARPEDEEGGSRRGARGVIPPTWWPACTGFSCRCRSFIPIRRCSVRWGGIYHPDKATAARRYRGRAGHRRNATSIRREGTDHPLPRPPVGLTIERVDPEGAIEVRSLNRRAKKLPTSTQDRRLVLEEVSVDRKRFLIGRMEVDDAAFRESVEAAIQQQHPVDRWREWQGTPTVSIALPLSSDARPGTFYAFLPMDRVAPFNGCLDAPFYPDAHRRDLNLSNPLNGFLLNQVAELCLVVAETLADAEETRPELAAAAIDAIAWTDECKRLFDACERTGLAIGALRLPAMRRRSERTRWARLDAIRDWKDDAFRITDRNWLVRVCDVPMLPRKLGEKRVEALAHFVAKTNFVLDAAAENWAEWAPALATDLARRKKLVRGDWEYFYTTSRRCQ